MTGGFYSICSEIGWRAADHWLAENLSAVGNRSTVDLTGLLPQKDGSLSVPSVLKQEAAFHDQCPNQECLT